MFEQAYRIEQLRLRLLSPEGQHTDPLFPIKWELDMGRWIPMISSSELGLIENPEFLSRLLEEQTKRNSK